MAAATLLMAAPVVAGPEQVKSWFSFDAMGCMRLKECTEDIEKVTSLDDVIKYYGDDRAEFPTVGKEADKILKGLNAIGATVYLADARYFPTTTRGLYYPEDNTLYLNAGPVVKETKLINVLRHEGWHAVQDCMAGGLDNKFIAVMHTDDNVPQYWKDMAKRLYPAAVVPWEQEAKWIATEKDRVHPALEACAAGPLWETYEPTPKTREWLVKENFIK